MLEPPANERLRTDTHYTAAPVKTSPHTTMQSPSPNTASAGISPQPHPPTYTSRTPPGAATAHRDSPTHVPPHTCARDPDSNALDAPCGTAADSCGMRGIVAVDAAHVAGASAAAVPAAPQAAGASPATAPHGPRTWAQYTVQAPSHTHAASTALQQRRVAPQANPAASRDDRLPGTATAEPPPMQEPPVRPRLPLVFRTWRS